MSDYGFGVVGCGLICDTHIEAVNRLDNAQVLAVCDTREDAAKAKAEQWGCDWYTDYEKMLARDDIHAVNVVVPSGIHAKLGVQAADAGKHVICTKPIDITLEATDALIEAGVRNGVKIGATHQYRSYALYRRFKDALETGSLGKPLYGIATVPWYRSDEYYGDGWHGTKALDGGGALINQSIHYIDLLIWMMGPVRSLAGYADAMDHDIEVEDCAVAALRFESGAMGMILGTTCTYQGAEARLSIHGSKGNALAAGDELMLWDVEGDEHVSNPSAGQAGGAADPGKGMPEEAVAAHSEQIGDLLAAAEEGREPALNGQEARRALEVVLAVYKSSETGQFVEFPLR